MTNRYHGRNSSLVNNWLDDGGASSAGDPKKYLSETDYSKIPDDIAIRSP